MSLSPAVLPPLEGTPILIVDDDEQTGRELCQVFKAWGARPVVAADATQAVRLACIHSDAGEPFIGVLISGLGSQQKAFAMAAQLRNQRLRTGPFCLLLPPASEPHAQLMTQCLRLNVAAYLIKPLRTDREAPLTPQFINDLHDFLLALREGPTDTVAPASIDATEDSWLGAAQRLRFLLVEDNPVNQIESAAQIQLLGHEVHVVAQGQAALTVLAQATFKIDCVLMDLGLPDMTGLEVTCLIRAGEAGDGDALPIIGLTGAPGPALPEGQTTRDQCLQAGMDDLLYKPLRLRLLFPSLNRILRLRTNQRTARHQLSSRAPRTLEDLGRVQSLWAQHVPLYNKEPLP